MNYSNKVGAPIFVVGRNRSGTTLMVNVLGKHSMLYSPESETGFFSYLWRIRKIFPDISDEKDLIDLIYFIANMLHI